MTSDRPRHKNKDFEALFEEAVRHGWRIERTRNQHFRLLCPSECGQHIAIAPSTPSDRRSLRNLRSAMRKCARSGI